MKKKHRDITVGNVQYGWIVSSNGYVIEIFKDKKLILRHEDTDMGVVKPKLVAKLIKIHILNQKNIETEKEVQDFAESNADGIFSMRIEGTFLYENEEVPKEFIEKIVDNKEHAKKIKENIKNNIIADYNNDPYQFKRNGDGDLTYDYEMYDYGYAVDSYCEELYEEQNPKEKYLVITLDVQDGERRHKHVRLHTTKAKNIQFVAERYAASYWGKGEHNGDWWWINGEFAIRMSNVQEIDESEYNIMSKYL